MKLYKLFQNHESVVHSKQKKKQEQIIEHDTASLVAKEGEDESALVCEFGAMKRGLSTMIPVESRRFWFSSEVKELK